MLKKLAEELENSEIFLNWKKDNPKSYLSHFFVQVSSKLDVKSPWEAGYYNPDGQKVTVFFKDGEEFVLKNTDDVFKKETS